MKKLFALPLLLALLVPLLAPAEDRIAYKGRLENADGTPVVSRIPLHMTFSLYAQATGGTPLWSRSYAVHVESDGSFYAELCDSEGSPVGKPSCPDLASALAAAGSAAYIGLIPDTDLTELAPRELLSPVPFAAHATFADTAERIEAQTLTTSTLSIPQPAFSSLTITNALLAAPGAKIVLSLTGDNTLAIPESIRLTHTLSGISTTSPNAIPDSTFADTLVVNHGYAGVQEGAYFSNIIPRGHTVYHEGTHDRYTSLGQ